jgi:hypothetical protein
VHNASAAKPRQTDLVATYGPDHYLIEAKWEQHPADVSHIDGIRSRLGRTAGTVIGVIIAVGGFSDTAVDDILRDRSTPILVFDRSDLDRILAEPDELLHMLRRKRTDLVVHGRVNIGTDEDLRFQLARPRPLSDFPDSRVQLLDSNGQPLPHITCGGGFGQFTYTQELPDIDWVTAGGCGVSIDMSLRPYTAEGLPEVLHELHRMGWITDHPRWSIQQSSRNWHGVGARSFIEALRKWAERVQDLPDAHHSEEIAFYDTFTGGYYSLTASIANYNFRQVRVRELSFQLIGTPLDASPFQHIHDTFNVVEPSYFRPRVEQAVKRHRLSHRVRLEPVGYVVIQEQTNDKPMVCGILARNPFSGSTELDIPDDWPGILEHTDLLVCDIRSYHGLDFPKEEYFLYMWEFVSTSDADVIRLVADW